MLGMLEVTFLSNSMVGQPLLPEGSVIISPRFIPPDASSECIGSPASADDDSARIQQAIEIARGTVFFKAGCYYLKRSLRLRSGLTYLGEGSWQPRYASTLIQTASPDPVTGLGLPIFSVDGVVQSVAIVGLAFDAPFVTKAKGISAANPDALLANSTIRGNYFLIELAECIDTAMVSTRIERNGFGTNGGDLAYTQYLNQGGIPLHHRHIRSVYSGGRPVPNTGENWIVDNVLRSACCETTPGSSTASESMLFESRVPLHIIGNDFEAGDADTTLRIRGVPEVFIEGNWFEANHGQAQTTISPRASNVHLQDNHYVMQGYPKTVNMCNGEQTQGNCFVLEFEPASSTAVIDASLSATHAYIGYEVVTALPSDSDGRALAELVPADLFADCHLTITGPFYLTGVIQLAGMQVGGNPSCH
jgi:hypothetical protein